MRTEPSPAEIRRAAIASRKESPFLTTAEAAVYTNTSERTLERLRRKGGGPPFRSHGRPIRYHITDLDAWSESRRRT
jgi:excisionase family DNA binding protein